MKKKIFTLLTLALVSIGTAWAGDVYKLQLNGKNVEYVNGTKTEGDMTFFGYNSGKHNFNTKFKDCTYDGVTYTSGLKYESDTKISWTSTAAATVTIVQSDWSKTVTHGTPNTIKFDDTVLETASASTATSGCLIYTLTDVAAGAHSITRGSGESGLFAVTVEYTGAVMTQLDAPEISVAGATGTVTIGAVANATKVTYTTDGSDPTAESTEYTAPFIVEDGTVVNAIAIGDNVNYISSDVATKTAYLTGFTVAAPVINQFNGTVAIACDNIGATIEYSTDGGSNWTAYSRAFTVSADTNIKARASREGCTTSDVTEATITAVAANTKTKTLVMAYGAFDADGKVLTGKTTDVANGYTLTMLTDQNKSWSGRNKITISEIGAERTTICGSNGVQCRLDLPEGVKATQLRLYSYVNSATNDTKSAWKEVMGENLNSTLKEVPMGAFTDVADYLANPDVRIFPLDNVEGSITFTNGGNQTCFVMVLDILESNVTATIAESGYSTISCGAALDFANATPSGLKAYAVSALTSTSATLTEVSQAPANTGIILQGTAGREYTIPVIASASEIATNYLKAAVTATAVKANAAYVLKDGKFKQVTSESSVPAGKAYLLASDIPAGANIINFDFGGETTGINEELRMKNEESVYYNIAGQRVAQPTKGLYIVNGKKVVIK